MLERSRNEAAACNATLSRRGGKPITVRGRNVLPYPPKPCCRLGRLAVLVCAVPRSHLPLLQAFSRHYPAHVYMLCQAHVR